MVLVFVLNLNLRLNLIKAKLKLTLDKETQGGRDGKRFRSSGTLDEPG